MRQNAKNLYDQEQKKYKNHLNQEFTVILPNKIWVSDVTYFRYKVQVFYIFAILDLYSRMVVGFRISHKNSTQLTKGTFKQAYENRKPESVLFFHTDKDQKLPFQNILLISKIIRRNSIIFKSIYSI